MVEIRNLISTVKYKRKFNSVTITTSTLQLSSHSEISLCRNGPALPIERFIAGMQSQMIKRSALVSDIDDSSL